MAMRHLLKTEQAGKTNDGTSSPCLAVIERRFHNTLAAASDRIDPPTNNQTASCCVPQSFGRIESNRIVSM
jgi:hypothetical protein